jgi:hypothetical protein
MRELVVRAPDRDEHKSIALETADDVAAVSEHVLD